MDDEKMKEQRIQKRILPDMKHMVGAKYEAQGKRFQSLNAYDGQGNQMVTGGPEDGTGDPEDADGNGHARKTAPEENEVSLSEKK